MSDEGLIKGILGIVAVVIAVFAFTAAVPIFSVYLLIRGWDNAGFLTKALAFLFPLGGLWTIISSFTDDPALSTGNMLLLVGAVVLNYVLIAIAYSRRQFVGM